jgi:hypothetical protein
MNVMNTPSNNNNNNSMDSYTHKVSYHTTRSHNPENQGVKF